MDRLALYLGPAISLDSMLSCVAGADVQSFRSHRC